MYNEKNLRTQGHYWFTRTAQMQHNLEVSCQCYSFHYISKAENVLNVILNETLNDFLVQRALQESIISRTIWWVVVFR